MNAARGEIIIVRSLADSDLGIFTAHRASATSKQRAFAITTPVARQLLDATLYDARAADLDVICIYGRFANRETRHVSKASKNWRLGGNMIGARECAFLDSKDFVLFRSLRGNAGDTPVLMTFVGRQRERLLHAGIGASIGARFKGSVAVEAEGSEYFESLAAAFPPIPAHLAVGPHPSRNESEEFLLPLIEREEGRRRATRDG